MTTRKFLAVLGLTLALAGFLQQHPAHAQQKPNVQVKEWRIPYLIFLTGPLAGHALGHKWVVDQVVADINASGGIAGKPIVIEYMDTGLDPTKAATAMGRAIDSKAICILGPMNDMECKAAMPLAVREQLFAFSGTGTEPVAKQFAPWMCDVTAPIHESATYGPSLWLRHNPGIKSVIGIVQPMYPMIGLSWKAFAQEIEKRKVKAQPMIEVPSGLMELSSIGVKAVGSGADAFWIGASEDNAAKIIKELTARGVERKNMWLFSSSVGPTFFKQVAGGADGCYTNSATDYEYTPAFARLTKLYKESHGGASLHPLAHIQGELLYLIKEAIETQGITGDPAKLKEERKKIAEYAFNRKGFKGIKYTYDIVSGHGQSIPQYLFQIRNNRPEFVEVEIPRY